jgi:hypothetical protein
MAEPPLLQPHVPFAAPRLWHSHGCVSIFSSESRAPRCLIHRAAGQILFGVLSKLVRRRFCLWKAHPQGSLLFPSPIPVSTAQWCRLAS